MVESHIKSHGIQIFYTFCPTFEASFFMSCSTFNGAAWTDRQTERDVQTAERLSFQTLPGSHFVIVDNHVRLTIQNMYH